MPRYISIPFIIICIIFSVGCPRSYKITPVPFKMPAAYNNAVTVNGAQVGARAFVDKAEAKKAFGFDIRNAGMLPVQLVFDNQGSHSLEIVAQQTFLEDAKGNLWPILSRQIAYERATKYATSKEIAKEGAYHGFWGAAAGSIIGAAIGIVTGENVAEIAGKGAAVGAAAGATLGGISVYESDEARRRVINDLRDKSLQAKAVKPKTLAHGFLFFPGEAESAKQLRLQLLEKDTGRIHILQLGF